MARYLDEHAQPTTAAAAENYINYYTISCEGEDDLITVNPEHAFRFFSVACQKVKSHSTAGATLTSKQEGVIAVIQDFDFSYEKEC